MRPALFFVAFCWTLVVALAVTDTSSNWTAVPVSMQQAEAEDPCPTWVAYIDLRTPEPEYVVEITGTTGVRDCMQPTDANP